MIREVHLVTARVLPGAMTTAASFADAPVELKAQEGWERLRAERSGLELGRIALRTKRAGRDTLL